MIRFSLSAESLFLKNINARDAAKRKTKARAGKR
jgi:hypothetical protein